MNHFISSGSKNFKIALVKPLLKRKNLNKEELLQTHFQPSIYSKIFRERGGTSNG